MLCEGRMWQELPRRPRGLSKIAVLYLDVSAVLSELLTGMWKRGTRLCLCFSQPSCTNWVPLEGNRCTCGGARKPSSEPGGSRKEWAAQGMATLQVNHGFKHVVCSVI